MSEPQAADPLCVCGHPESGHVSATPTQKVCIAVGMACGCIDFEPEPEDDDDA